jgi:hypothetical protein
MKQTVVEWLEEQINLTFYVAEASEMNKRFQSIYEQAREMEKTNTDNKVIHFAEWITKKHTTVLMTLYDQFEEQYYKETYETK